MTQADLGHGLQPHLAQLDQLLSPAGHPATRLEIERLLLPRPRLALAGVGHHQEDGPEESPLLAVLGVPAVGRSDGHDVTGEDLHGGGGSPQAGLELGVVPGGEDDLLLGEGHRVVLGQPGLARDGDHQVGLQEDLVRVNVAVTSPSPHLELGTLGGGDQ